MKHIKLLLRIMIILLLSMFVSYPVSAEVEEVDIVTTPEKVLFDVENMKPGDWVTKELVIKNSGMQTFDYVFSSNFKSGSEQLYNELFLTITHEGKKLYEGKLGGFSKISPGLLINGLEEVVTFRVDFPEQLGNKFQGLTTEVEFSFYGKESLDDGLPVDGLILPNTATRIFNLFAVGLGLLGIGCFLLILQRRSKKTV